jgi:hypothetical protein
VRAGQEGDPHEPEPARPASGMLQIAQKHFSVRACLASLCVSVIERGRAAGVRRPSQNKLHNGSHLGSSPLRSDWVVAGHQDDIIEGEGADPASGRLHISYRHSFVYLNLKVAIVTPQCGVAGRGAVPYIRSGTTCGPPWTQLVICRVCEA